MAIPNSDSRDWLTETQIMTIHLCVLNIIVYFLQSYDY